MKKYNRINLQVDLANQLYEFQINNDNSTHKITESSIQKSNENQQIEKDKNNINKDQKYQISIQSPNSQLNKTPFQEGNEINEINQNNSNQNQSPTFINTSQQCIKSSKLSLQKKCNSLSSLQFKSPPILKVSQNKTLHTTQVNNQNKQLSLTQQTIQVRYQQQDEVYSYDQFGSDDKKQKSQDKKKIQSYIYKIKEEAIQKQIEKPKYFWQKKQDQNVKSEKGKGNDGKLNKESISLDNQKDLPFFEKVKYVIDKFKSLVKEKQKIFLSQSYFICFSKYYNNWQLLKKAFQFIRNDLDICVLISQLQELQKIKNILLSKQQQIIFNFIPKPTISMQSELRQSTRQLLMKQKSLNKQNKTSNQDTNQIGKKDLPTLHKRMAFNSLNAYQLLIHQERQRFKKQIVSYLKKLLIQYYNYIQQLLKQNRVNQKLIEYLGFDLCELFDAYAYLINNAQQLSFSNQIVSLDHSKQKGIFQQNDEINEESKSQSRRKSQLTYQKMDLRKSLNVGLEGLNQLFNGATSMKSMFFENEEDFTSEMGDSDSSSNSNTYENSREFVAQDNIEFLNQQNVITDYFNKSIHGFIQNNKQIR